MSAQRNLGLALGATLVATMAILLTNWHVDPFSLRSADTATSSPTEGRFTVRQPFWHKAFAVLSVQPAAVILGTSRADWALDGAHPGFTESARPAYNLALEGASVDQMRELLMHAHRTSPVRQAVIGLDLEAFLSAGLRDFDPAILAGHKASLPAWVNQMRLNLSWRALRATAEQLSPQAARGPAGGRPQLAALGGQRQVFRSSEYNNFHARRVLLFPSWSRDTRWESEPRRAASMRALRDLVSLARREGIDLRLFISPVHARYLEAYRQVGWWPLFDAWKRGLVATLEDEASESSKKAYPLWDFSGFNSVTMEAVPPSGDLKASMRWYIDSSHYSREHGDLILERVLGRPGEHGVSVETGVLMDQRNIDMHLRRTWQDAERYRVAFPVEVGEVARIVEFIRRSARK